MSSLALLTWPKIKTTACVQSPRTRLKHTCCNFTGSPYLSLSPLLVPCSYLFSKSLGGHQINRIISRGVSKLHDFRFIVIGTICDDAAPDRKFVREHSTSTLDVGRTPFGNWPLFMFTDRETLCRRVNEHGRGYSRTLTIGVQSQTWSQVEDVVHRKWPRLLRFTLLRKEHVNLDSFTSFAVQ